MTEAIIFQERWWALFCSWMPPKRPPGTSGRKIRCWRNNWNLVLPSCSPAEVGECGYPTVFCCIACWTHSQLESLRPWRRSEEAQGTLEQRLFMRRDSCRAEATPSTLTKCAVIGGSSLVIVWPWLAASQYLFSRHPPDIPTYLPSLSSSWWP